MINAAQIRAARALLDISQLRLSEMSGVSESTIKRLEAASQIRGSAESIWKVQRVLEDAGVEFIPAEGDKGPGVRLRENRRKDIWPG
jgi:transcriptional regulator with XRE-family HTH domain